MKMTNILSVFRFRRWDSEKKTRIFIKTLNTVFVVFFGLTVFAVYQASAYSTTLGIITAVVLFIVLIAFDLVNRASIFISKERRNLLQYKSNFEIQAENSIRAAIDESNQIRIELENVKKELDLQIEKNTKYANAVREKIELLNTLINKKRRGKKLHLPKDVKNCLVEINRTIK
jgi:hypothetical protein